jgi:tripartite-type tricarboxylate transporter receptor subunit TctC
MKLPRRRFLHLAAGAAVLPAVSRDAMAQSYPVRPVRLVIGFPAGGSGDIIARLIGQELSVQLGQPFVIENRPGAGSSLAAEMVVRAAPDGYTLLFVSTPNVINTTFYQNLSFNFARDIAPVGAIVRYPNVMEVNPSVPARTVAEFIAYAKANPGKISMASNGNGTSSHVAGELFKMMTGINMVHVPYRGAGLSLIDLIGGQVQVTFDVLASSIGYIRSGRLRALAVTTTTRIEALPEVPVLADYVPGYESDAWSGIGAPRSTPAAIIDRLNREINAILAEPKMIARLVELGALAIPMSRAEFAALIATDTEKWGRVIKFSGARPD